MGPDSDQANVLLLTFKTKIEEAISLVNQMPEDLRQDAWTFWQKVSIAIKVATVGIKKRKRVPGGKESITQPQAKKDVIETVEEDVVDDYVLDEQTIVSENIPVSEVTTVDSQDTAEVNSVTDQDTSDVAIVTEQDTSDNTNATEQEVPSTSGQHSLAEDLKQLYHSVYTKETAEAVEAMINHESPKVYTVKDEFIIKEPMVTTSGCIITEEKPESNAINVVVQDFVNDQVITSLMTIDKPGSPLKKTSPKKKAKKTSPKKNTKKNVKKKVENDEDNETQEGDEPAQKTPKKKSSKKRVETSEDIVSKALAENLVLPDSDISDSEQRFEDMDTEVGETPLAENKSGNKRKKPRRSSRPPKPKKISGDQVVLEDGTIMEGEEKKRVKGENKTELGPVDCPVCGIKLAYYTSLQAHMRKHTGDRPFVCSMCPKRFTTKANMLRHERTHLGEKPFECEECHKCFTEKKTLKNHMRCHTGERPYKCTECDMSFRQSGTLKSHMHRHSGHKGNLCDLCGRAFRQKTQLRIHLKRHLKLKTLKCTKCDLQFYCKAELRRHEVKHSNLKPYACSQCPKTYSRLQYLREHENSHLGITTYSCSQCDLHFSDHASYYRHMQKHKKDKGEGEESVHLVVDSEAMENETVDSVPALLVTADHIQHLFGVNGGNNSEVYRIALVDQPMDDGQATQVNQADFSAINLLASATTQVSMSQDADVNAEAVAVPETGEEMKQMEAMI